MALECHPLMLVVDHLRVSGGYLDEFRHRFPWRGLPDFECHVLEEYTNGMYSLFQSFPPSDNVRASCPDCDLDVKPEVGGTFESSPFYCVYDAYSPDDPVGCVAEL